MLAALAFLAFTAVHWLSEKAITTVHHAGISTGANL